MYTMKVVKVQYTIDQKAAIKAGKDHWGAVCKVIQPSSLTQEQRDELAYCNPVDRVDYALDLNSPIVVGGASGSVVCDDTIVDSSDPTNVERIINARIARRAELMVKQAKEAEERATREKAAYESKLAEMLRKPVDDFINRYTNPYELNGFFRNRQAFNAPEMTEKRAAIEARVVQLNVEREEKLRAAEEAKRLMDKQHAVNEAHAKEWVAEHGSALLRARLAGEADGYEWWALLKVEWLHAMLADVTHGPVIQCDDDWYVPRRRPTLKEITRFNSIRKCLQDRGVVIETAEMVYLKSYKTEDDYGEKIEPERPYQTNGCAAMRLIIQCFGETYSRFVLLFDEEQTEK